ncbi:MAG TPA: hypothetical protein VGG43_08260 [Acidimicrobiales bacterium]|jgi:hypothetical protein
MPLVAVAGPPGSGGEVIAAALAAMGLRLVAASASPSDAGARTGSGPDSGAARLDRVGDELLGLLEGTWWAPPELIGDWEHRPEIAEAVARGLASVTDLLAADPDAPDGIGSGVWYDVRQAVLLPLWRQHLQVVQAAVVTWRRPGATVARVAPDGISSIHALALWEAQLVGALTGAIGLPVLGVNVDQVAADPKKWTASAASFLEDLGLELPLGAEERATEVLEASPALTGPDGEPVGNTAAEESAMASQLKGMLDEAEGAHRRWDPATTYTLNPWTAALLAAERGARLSATQAANAWVAADDAHRAMRSALSTLEWTVDRLAAGAFPQLPSN